MFAAVRSGAGWLLVGTALGLGACSSIPIPDIDIPVPSLPGFGPREIPAAMEPIPLSVSETTPALQETPRVVVQSERPAFFVQWQGNAMPGLTKRPTIAPASQMPAYPEDAMRSNDTGVTTLDSCVTIEGRLVDVKLFRSSGSLSLDSATLAWARMAKFTPAEFNGQAMAVCGFKLDHEWRLDRK